MAPKVSAMRAMILLQENTDKTSVLHKLIKTPVEIFVAVYCYDKQRQCYRIHLWYYMKKNASLHIYTLSLNFFLQTPHCFCHTLHIIASLSFE